MSVTRGTIELQVSHTALVRRFMAFPGQTKRKILENVAKDVLLIDRVRIETLRITSYDNIKIKADVIPFADLRKQMNMGEYVRQKQTLSNIFTQCLKNHVFQPVTS